ncbi:hypothetical protein Hanom_Chr08g00701951 [Helianthus anomalus]
MSSDSQQLKKITIKELLSTRTLTEISTDVNSSHLIFDVQGKILVEIKKNQDMWERLLEEPPSRFRDAGLEHIKEQSRHDNLVFSFLNDALSTVKKKRCSSARQNVTRSLLQGTRFLLIILKSFVVLNNTFMFIMLYSAYFVYIF